MKKQYIFFASLVTALFLFSGSSNNPPNGRTGAPGDGLCTDCHSGGSPDQDGEVEITGLPDIIAPQSTHRITVTVRNPNGLGATAGFQMTALDATDVQIGTLSNAGENATVTSSGGREYFEHNPSVAFSGSNEVSWSVDWTAPEGPPESTVTIYAAGNVSNGNGQSSGDLVLTTSAMGVISEVSSVGNLPAVPVRVFPNPASGILNLGLDGITPDRYSIIDARGNEVRQADGVVSTQVDVSDLSPGMYFIRFWFDSRVETIQWIKQ